jgi:lysozyme
MNPIVADIFHGDRVIGDRPGEPNGFIQAAAAGIKGIIHKATQGVVSADPLYAARRNMAAAAGVPLWGAYDFNTGDPVSQQVEFFMKAAQPDKATFCVLDFEDNTHSEMTLAQCVEYLRQGDAALSEICGIERRFGIYSGNRIKELITGADQGTRDFLALHPFWLSEYGLVARLVDVNGHPLPWSRYSLWQCSADGAGPLPHSVPGIPVNGLDLNVCDSGYDRLAAEWTGGATPSSAIAQPAPSTAAVPAIASSVSMGPRQHNIVATCFGGAGDSEASAYGGHVDPNQPGVALPFRFRTPPKVTVYGGNQSVTCAVVDVGPHNTNDQYWASASRPQAESQSGNHAGIDMTPAVFAALGVNPGDPAYGEMTVDWEFAA